MMEFYHKEDGFPMSISIETMSVDEIDDDTCLYSSIVMDMETNKVIAEFCHDSLLGRRKWAEEFFIELEIKQKKVIEKMEYKLTDEDIEKYVLKRFFEFNESYRNAIVIGAIAMRDNLITKK